MISQSKADRLSQDLKQFTGTTQWYRLSSLFPRLLSTEGVKYLAEEARAYWLIDAIASYQPGAVIQGSDRLKDFQVWELSVENSVGRLVCKEDSDEPPVIIQDIPFTDFPLKKIKIYVEGKVILLPSEH